MKTEQYVMAYGVEQDRLRAILPDGFASLRLYCVSMPRFLTESAAILSSTQLSKRTE